MVYLTCSNPECNRSWNYKGKAIFYTCCPMCHHNVRISTNKARKEAKKKKEVAYIAGG